MCTALPTRRSPVTANTAATIHSLLWPTVVLSSGPIGDVRRAPGFAPRSGMTLPPEDLRRLFLVRGGGFLPRRILALRGPGRSTLPRSSPFLWCPIVLPILRSCSIDFQGSALRLVHTKLLRREGPDPLRARQFGDFDLESLPYFSGPIKPHAEFGGSGVEPRGERVQIDAPQHQQHGHHDQHRKPATPTRGLPPQGAVLGALLCGPRRFCGERSLVPALGGGHQLASTGGSAVLVAARSLAEALRGFSSISRREGVRTSPLRNTGFAPQTHTGSSGGQTHRPSRPEMNRFTRRSSPEWNVMTTSLPPGVSSRSEASRARLRLPNSSFTLTRTAWKILFAGLPPLSFQPTAARTASYRSVVTASGRLRTISRATRLASPRGTSPYSESTLDSSPTSTVLRKSAAVSPDLGSIRISSGPSSMYENPRPGSST